MPSQASDFLASEEDTLRIGTDCGRRWSGGGIVFLSGELGAGKTTLCRGILRGMGHEGLVQSPAYTLVEPYQLALGQVFHFDLYRLEDARELENIGIRDYTDSAALCLVEWPERGGALLPPPDLCLSMEVEGKGRRLCWQVCTPRGEALAAGLGA